MSQIEGILADKPNKIRGDRTDLLVYEELGSWPNSIKAFLQGDALVGIQGVKFGIKLGGGELLPPINREKTVNPAMGIPC